MGVVATGDLSTEAFSTGAFSTEVLAHSVRCFKTNSNARAGNHQALLHDKLAKHMQILIACGISNGHANPVCLELLDALRDGLWTLGDCLIVDKTDAMLGLSL